MSDTTGTTDTAAETKAPGGTVPPGETLTALVAGDSVVARLDALFARHFSGTEIAGVTRFWNAVHAFKEDVKRLLGEAHAASDVDGAPPDAGHAAPDGNEAA